MRTHGNLTKWNDDRVFGFITPAKGTADIFVHISEFPQDGIRPQLHELISFEVEINVNGKKRAVRVMRAGQRTLRRPAAAREHHPPRTHKLARALTLLAIAGLGSFGYYQQKEQTMPPETPTIESPTQPAPTTSFSCDGRTTCSQMSSCEEAMFFIRSCPNTTMDGDNDGIPCERQWCN